MADEPQAGMITYEQAARLLDTTEKQLKTLSRLGWIVKPEPGTKTYSILKLIPSYCRLLHSGRMTIADAAEFIGRTAAWIQYLAEHGYVEKDPRGGVRLQDVVRGYLRWKEDDERRSSKSASATRVQDARARDIELRTAERERALISFEDADAAMVGVVGRVRAELVGLPARVTRDKALRRQLESEVDGTLFRIAAQLTETSASLRSGGELLEAEPEGNA